jgi:signal peptidase I
MGSHVHSGAVTPPPENPTTRGLRERADPLLATVIFALFARTFLFQAFEVPSSSMEKNVLVGDRLLVNKFLYAPGGRGGLSRLLPRRSIRRGDVIVFKFPDDPRRDFIKRVVALPGETLAIRNKTVYVNGRPLEEPYTFHADESIWPDDPSVAENRRRRDQFPPHEIRAGSYFVMGDNRDDSNDSRFWGDVRSEAVEGRALIVYWSVPPRSSGATPPRAGGLRSPIELLRKTRWDRAFLPVR